MENLFFKPIEFINNLRYMGIGMLGILIVMAVIIAVTYTLDKLTSKKPKE